MRDNNAEFDVVVVGGGPGGATLSALVAMQDHRVLLIEREKFPRYQIGESLLPSTVHGICKLLGVSEDLEKASFMAKRGGTFRWGSNPEPWTFQFALSSAFSTSASMAYQVERMKFDQILLDNAMSKGVQVRQECAAVDIVETDGRVSGVIYDDSDGIRQEVAATFVVDASGNRSRIHNHVGGNREYSEFFRNVAVFGYFEGGKRLPAPNSGNILCAAFEDGWFWYIPLTNELTSVGAVVRHDSVDKVQGGPEQALMRLIGSCPLIAEYLSDAHRVISGPYGEVRVRKDYSYCKSAFSRPGMVLIGDAACFIDPVFSSGVHLATYSALLAARSINTVLADDIDEPVCFAEFEARYRQEYAVFHDFLVGFYDMHQEKDSYFWGAKKVTGSSASHLESFVELVGGAASGDRGLLRAGSYAERRGGALREFARSVEQLSGSDDDSELFEAELVRDVLETGTQLQVLGAFGEEEDVPVRHGGLISSADGMRWMRAKPEAVPEGEGPDGAGR